MCRIEGPAVIFDSGDQRSAAPLQLDRNLQPTIDSPIHDDIGDCLFEAQLKSERDVRRYAVLGPPLDPYCEAVQLGKVVA